jgi:hypothetical protein
MLSSILNSEHAIAVNIEIMRAFVRIRQLLAGDKLSRSSSRSSSASSPATTKQSLAYFRPFEN